MKKQLQSQIKSLAEQILSESDSKDTKKMKETARRLYEHLTVLEYLEVQILGQEESLKEEGSLDSKSYRENNWFKEPEPVPQPEDREELIEPVMEKIKDLVAQMPEESQKVDALLEEVLPRKEYHKNDLEEFEVIKAQDLCEKVFKRLCRHLSVHVVNKLIHVAHGITLRIYPCICGK